MAKRIPCPGKPEDYVWVKSREGAHWRRKRGSVNAATLNSGYRASAEKTKFASPAAKRVRTALEPYLRGITTGRVNNRICNAFRKSLKEKNCLSLRYLIGIEMQRDYPLDGMLVCNYTVVANERKVRIEIPIERGSVRQLNALASDYYFEAVLLYGNVSRENELETESIESGLYRFRSEEKKICVMELTIPGGSEWCLLLKISSLEGNEMAAHTKHYRMKVIDVSSG